MVAEVVAITNVRAGWWRTASGQAHFSAAASLDDERSSRR